MSGNINFDDIENQIEEMDIKQLEELYSFLTDYDETPVDIDTFIDDPEFLGGYFQNGYYDSWREELHRIYPSPYYSPHWLVALRGAIGLGKSTFACTGIAYDTHRLLCLANPQTANGLVPSTKILFAVFNMTLGLASEIWDVLSQMFTESPYFSRLISSQGTGRRRKEDTLFPKRTDFFVGSRIGHSLGKAVYEAVLDEANFQVLKDQTISNFNSLIRRMQSRFMQLGGGVPGKIWIVSSETEKASPLNNIIDMYGNQDGVHVVKKSLWDVKPERYSGEKFRVFIGTDLKEPRIIEENETVPEDDEVSVREIPVEHKKDFEADINASLRDLAGESTRANYTLFKLIERLGKAQNFIKIFPDELQIDFDDDNDHIINYCLMEEYFKNPVSGNSPKCVHIDIGLTGDRLGIASSYVRQFVEREYRDPTTFEVVKDLQPLIVTEFAFGIKAKAGQQIPLYKVRMFLLKLAKMGYNIDYITCDGFQSADMIQLMTKAGFNSELLSVDKTSIPYLGMRDYVYHGLHVLPSGNKILYNELKHLEVSPDGKKVDHPKQFPDKTKGSKDIADAVCGSSQKVRNNADKYRLYFITTSKEENVKDELKEMFWGEQ